MVRYQLMSVTSTPGFSFSNVVDMFFSWPTSGGSAAADADSGVLGYQYQLNGTGSTWYGTQTDSTCGIDYIPSTDASYTLTLLQDGGNIVSGNNIVYFRSVDVACNFFLLLPTELVIFPMEEQRLPLVVMLQVLLLLLLLLIHLLSLGRLFLPLLDR